MDNSDENVLDLGSDNSSDLAGMQGMGDVADSDLSKLSLPELVEKRDALKWMSVKGTEGTTIDSTDFFSLEYRRISNEIEKRQK